MTGYEQFINDTKIETQGKHSLLFELEVSRTPDNIINFTTGFLALKGYDLTGHEHGNAIYNNKYIFAGAVQDGNKIAIRINQI